MNTKKLFTKIALLAKKTNTEVYIVGGYIRDQILQLESKDIDFVVIGDGIRFAKLVKKHFHGDNFAIYKRFGTAKVTLFGFDLEFVGARSESYQLKSRKPIVSSADLKSDLSRRDFTINAIAKSVFNEKSKLIDPFGGQKDIINKIIKTPLDASITFSDDPLRILRAVRFASRFGYQIETKTLDAIKLNVFRLKIVSNERIMEELNKMLSQQNAKNAISLLISLNLFKTIFPYFGNFQNDINNFFRLNNYRSLNIIERFAAICFFAKCPSKQIKIIFYNLKFSNEFIKKLSSLLEQQQNVESLISAHSRGPILKHFLFLSGPNYASILHFYFIIGFKFNYNEVITALRNCDKNFVYSKLTLAINGNDIKNELKLIQGVEIGNILKKCIQMVLNEEIGNERNHLIEALHNENFKKNV